MIKRVLALLGFALAFVSLSADIAPPTDLPSRARGAARIVVASVADVRARFASNQFGDQLIISTATLEVAETLKGAPATMLEIEFEGGTVGDLTLKVSDLPSLTPGDRAVFFLDQLTGPGLLLHDRGRGILRLSQDDEVENTSMSLATVRQQVRDAIGTGR